MEPEDRVRSGLIPALLALPLAVGALLVSVGGAFAADVPGRDERRVSFDAGWRFSKGDPAGAERPDFTDKDWRALDVPHDWAIEGPFDRKISPHQGSLPFYGVALKAVAYAGGQSVAEATARTAGRAARVVLSPDRADLHADGEDLSFITVRIEDAQGTLVPDADNLVRFELSGPGRIVAVDNGSPASLELFQAAQRKAFSGMALVVLRSKRGEPGAVRVRAVSEGLRSGEALGL